jgi:hypothetical protein
LLRHVATPWHEIVPSRAMRKKPPGTSTMDPVARMLALPAGTLLRVHTQGMLCPMGAILSRVVHLPTAQLSMADAPPPRVFEGALPVAQEDVEEEDDVAVTPQAATPAPARRKRARRRR